MPCINTSACYDKPCIKHMRLACLFSVHPEHIVLASSDVVDDRVVRLLLASLLYRQRVAMHTCAGNHFKVLVAPPALAWLKVMQEMQEEQPFQVSASQAGSKQTAPLVCVAHVCTALLAAPCAC
jgi:hypothetical protein